LDVGRWKLAAIASSGDEKAHLSLLPLDRLDGEAQSFAFPPGASKENRDVALAQAEGFPGFRPILLIALQQLERHAVVDYVDLVGGKSVEPDDFLFHHPRVCDHPSGARFAEERLFEGKCRGMLAIEKTAELL
jgi:hypothetical protein